MAQNFTIETAETGSARREAQRLRYLVYCQERGFEPPPVGADFESDEFDERAHHLILRRRSDRSVVGTARLIPGKREHHATCFPMQRYCDSALFRDLPIESLGEISRLAISKQMRRDTSASEAALRLGLMQGILGLSRELGLTHWCALMERSLLRLLQATGIHFAPLGPFVECSGLRQPSVAAIDISLASGRRQCPEFYNFLTRRQFSIGQPSRALVA